MNELEAARINRDLDLQGWSKFQLPDPTPMQEARDLLLIELRRATGNETIDLETYHEQFDDDEAHQNIQLQMVDYARRNGFARDTFEQQLPLFKAVLGLDLYLQKNPFLRIARPGKPQDNIGYHRDTETGGTAFDVSIWLPLVHLESKGVLKLMPGSHVRPREDFPYEQTEHPTITKGGALNEAGFLYAPKVHDPWFEDDLIAVEMDIGDALIFNGALMHGQKINEAENTRWSMDFVVTTTFVPRGVKKDYFETVCQSAVTTNGLRHQTLLENSLPHLNSSG